MKTQIKRFVIGLVALLVAVAFIYAFYLIATLSKDGMWTLISGMLSAIALIIIVWGLGVTIEDARNGL